MKYSISINSMSLDEKIPQGDRRWAQFNDSFINRELEPIEIADAIFLGHAYTGWHNGRRKAENFVKAQHLALDFDSEDEQSSIDYLIQNDFIATYASILHTTPSHTSDRPRSRVVFLLDEPIYNPQHYVNATRFLIRVFASDESCKDCSRFFYGAVDCELALPFHTLPICEFRVLYKRYEKHLRPNPEPRKPFVEPVTQTPVPDIEHEMTQSAIDEFNNQNRIENVLFECGYSKVSNRRWSRPGKPESGGVWVDHQNNKTYNHSENDPLYAGRNGKDQPSSPFDYYMQYRFNGDFKSAINSIVRSH